MKTRAAHAAPRYLSTISVSEIKNTALAPALAAVASNIISAQIAELAPGIAPPSLNVRCDGGACVGFPVPLTVTVNIQPQMDEVFFSEASELSVPLTAHVFHPYPGNKL